MGKIIFIIGGARSGKSSYGLEKAKEMKGRVAFIATCSPCDREMKRRVALHRKSRPAHWKTFEVSDGIAELVKETAPKFKVFIVECLTLLISGFMEKKYAEAVIKDKINEILKALKKSKSDAIIVSNEVGSGIIPQNKLARDFLDIAGRINQMTAKASDEVYFLVSGIPWRLK